MDAMRALTRNSTSPSLQPSWSKKRKDEARIPRYAHALLDAISFSDSAPELLNRLNETEWRNLLHLSDRMQLTLLVGDVSRLHLPPWVRGRIDRNYIDNGLRFSRLEAALAEINRALTERSIDFVLLKGFTHSSHFSPDPGLRSQGDVDIWCQPDLVFQAKDVLTALGYRPIGTSKGRHLDPMIREASWKWTGDYFAPDLPIPVDLHYKLWDETMEHIAGPSEAEIWQRRSPVAMRDGQLVSQLGLADALAFASLHVLMHLLHGDLRLQRAWELAFFLQKHSDNDEFWSGWKRSYSREDRQKQVIPFALCQEWFNCRLPACVREEIAMLSSDVLLWLDRYGWSPLESLFSTNKDELLLNLSLLGSFKSKVRVFARRLLPVHAAAGECERKENDGRSFRAIVLRTWSFNLQRVRHHLRVLPLTCWRTAAWWWRCQGLRRDSERAFSVRGQATPAEQVDNGRR